MKCLSQKTYSREPTKMALLSQGLINCVNRFDLLNIFENGECPLPCIVIPDQVIFCLVPEKQSKTAHEPFKL